MIPSPHYISFSLYYALLNAHYVIFILLCHPPNFPPAVELYKYIFLKFCTTDEDHWIIVPRMLASAMERFFSLYIGQASYSICSYLFLCFCLSVTPSRCTWEVGLALILGTKYVGQLDCAMKRWHACWMSSSFVFDSWCADIAMFSNSCVHWGCHAHGGTDHLWVIALLA